jgi:DNA-binding response OmpR family regulator
VSAAGLAAAPVRVFLAEDDDDLRELIAEELRRDGHEVIDVGTGHALGELLAAHLLHPAGEVIVVSDISLPGRSGLAVLKRHRDSAGCPRFIFITGLGSEELHDEALRVGALCLLEKPFELEELRRELARATQRPH